MNISYNIVTILLMYTCIIYYELYDVLNHVVVLQNNH